MRTFARDVRYALRQLRAHPGFTALAIVSLAIGIGAPTTIFTLVNATLLRPPPVREANRLVFGYQTESDGSGFHSFSYPQYKDYADRARTLTGLAAFDVEALSVATTGEPRISLGGLVTGNYFNVLGTTPELGRFFAQDEDGLGTTMRSAVVVSDNFWRTRLSGDSSAIGHTIQINGVAFTIVGVTRPEFSQVSVLVKPDLWTTMGTADVTRPNSHLDRRTYSSYQIVGRLAPGVAMPAAERELEGIAKQIEREHSDAAKGLGVDLFPFATMPTEARRGVEIFMALLMAFGGLILFVACGNVASMLLARGVARRRELAIRTALGAARAQLVAQLVTETVILFVGGATAAVGLTYAAAKAIVGFRPPLDFPVYLDVPIDWRVYGFTLALALLVGAVFGLAPGLQSTRVGVSSVLKEESGAVSAKSRGRSVVVVGQLAFTFMLLIGAGLVARALGGALNLDPGFNRTGVEVAMTDIAMARLDTAGSYAVAAAWRDGVATTPGVTTAALTTRAPLSTGNSTNSFKVEGADGRTATEFQGADWAAVSPEYFATLGIRIVAGRGFTSGDRFGSLPVAIVSEAFARKFYGDASKALGRMLQMGSTDASRHTIVGVAADTKVRSLAESPRPMLYETLAQIRVRKVTLLARSTRSDIGLVVRTQLRRANAAVPMMASMTYDDFIGIALLPQRLAAVVTGVLGIAGLLLATLGVYGIVAYSVVQRTREIGIRMAVGATPVSVVTTMAYAGLKLIAIGLGVGLVLSLAGTRVLSSFLLGVSPTDPLVFGAITIGLGSIALVACAIPASRAAGVDPLVALRSD